MTIFYGHRTNQELLIHNGFVAETNLSDVYELKLGLSAADQLYKKRASVLAAFNLKCSETFKICESFFLSRIEMLKCFFFVKVFITKTSKIVLINLLKLVFYTNFMLVSDLDKLCGPDLDRVLETLDADIDVRNFLVMRLQILLRMYRVTGNERAPETLNSLFITRMIGSEMNLIRKFKALLEGKI